MIRLVRLKNLDVLTDIQAIAQKRLLTSCELLQVFKAETKPSNRRLIGDRNVVVRVLSFDRILGLNKLSELKRFDELKTGDVALDFVAIVIHLVRRLFVKSADFKGRIETKLEVVAPERFLLACRDILNDHIGRKQIRFEHRWPRKHASLNQPGSNANSSQRL